MSAFTLATAGPVKWVSMENAPVSESAAARCTLDAVRQSLSHLDDVRVVSVFLNRTGRYTAQQDGAAPANLDAIAAHGSDAGAETDLPDFCDVRVEHMSGGHIVHTTIWVPLAWNGRFFGLGGQGNRTSAGWIYPDSVRISSLPRVLRNGFAAAETDAGNRDPRFADWGVDRVTGELDWGLIENWVHRSTHDMTVIGKAVTQAIHGEPPAFSYFQGTSGGGRQALMEVQRYPEDYDGVWSSDPGINWTKFMPSTIWPAVVMKDCGNPLAPAKLEVFRRAALRAAGPEAERDGFASAFEPPVPDTRSLIGESTPAGPITELDAEVMQRIWEGPRSPKGEFLWFGLRPDAESWGNNLYGSGRVVTTGEPGALEPEPFEIGRAYGTWVFRDSSWDWKSLTMDNFHEMVDISRRDFADVDTSEPDISAFRDAGGKLLLTHGLGDEIVPAAGSLHYYRRVVEAMGGIAATTGFARLFMAPGEGHSHITAAGPGLTLAAGMTALMNWVESGEAPDAIATERHDLATGERTMTRIVCAYPRVAVYRGSGDHRDAANFECPAG